MLGFLANLNKISYKIFTTTPMNFNKRSVKKVKHVVDMIPTFYFQDVYRCVKVYHHTYKTFTKKRWVNMKILDMFTKEFAAYDAAYYVQISTSLLLHQFSRKKPSLKEESESTKNQSLLNINSRIMIVLNTMLLE